MHTENVRYPAHAGVLYFNERIYYNTIPTQYLYTPVLCNILIIQKYFVSTRARRHGAAAVGIQ